MRTSTALALLLATAGSAAASASAQPGRGPSPVAKNIQALPISPTPDYVRKDAPTDPVILKCVATMASSAAIAMLFGYNRVLTMCPAHSQGTE